MIRKKDPANGALVGGLYLDLAVVLLSLLQLDLHGHFNDDRLIKRVQVGLVDYVVLLFIRVVIPGYEGSVGFSVSFPLLFVPQNCVHES